MRSADARWRVLRLELVHVRGVPLSLIIGIEGTL